MSNMYENDVMPEMVLSRQINRMLNYLESHDGISNYEATTRLSIGSPTKVISKMRQKGYDIRDRWEKGVNKYGEPWRAKKYYLAQGGR